MTNYYFVRYVKPSLTSIETEAQADQFLRDLGLGKETNFNYPWRPDGSPMFCKDADFLAETWKDTSFTFEGETIERGYPDKNCNEFIFTRA